LTNSRNTTPETDILPNLQITGSVKSYVYVYVYSAHLESAISISLYHSPWILNLLLIKFPNSFTLPRTKTGVGRYITNLPSILYRSPIFLNTVIPPSLWPLEILRGLGGLGIILLKSKRDDECRAGQTDRSLRAVW
jgi:hypothetical protein